MDSIAKRLRAARLQHQRGEDNLSKFAREVGETRQRLEHYEKGTADLPRAMRAKIAAHVGVSESWLEFGVELPKRSQPDISPERAATLARINSVLAQLADEQLVFVEDDALRWWRLSKR